MLVITPADSSCLTGARGLGRAGHENGGFLLIKQPAAKHVQPRTFSTTCENQLVYLTTVMTWIVQY